MLSNLAEFQRRQITLIARVTPYAMAGHLLNATVLAVAVAGSIPLTQLIIWCVYSYSIACLLLYRHLKNRGRSPHNFQRATKKAAIYSFFLALPWSSMAVLHLGALPRDEELILVALGIGMAASGTVLLSAMPPAAFSYMSAILIPGALKCIALNQKGYFLLGALALSSWGFLAALIAKITRDISERKKTELTLAERNVQLELAGKAALVGSYAYDTDTERVQVSEGYAAIHGFPEGTAEIARSEWEAGVHPEDVGRLEALRSQAFRQRQDEYNIEYRIVRSSGEIRWIEARSFISYDSNRHPQRVVGVSIDVTERRQTEQALADRSKQLELAGKVALAGSFAINLNAAPEDFAAQRMQVSAGFAAIYGLPAETAEITMSDWRSRVHPVDLPQFLERRHQALAEQRPESHLKYRIVRSCGEFRWIESRTFIEYDQTGHPKRLVGVNIDVTERRQTEALLNESNARLADALAAGQVMAFEWDAVTGLTQRSDNAADILGFEQGGVAGSPRNDFLRHVHPDDRVCFKTHIRELCPGNPSYAMSFRFVRWDGRQVWLEETAKGEFDATGRLLRIKGLTRDITERKRAEIALQGSEAKLAGILAIAGDAIVSIDGNQRITLFNEAAERLFGYSQGEVLGQPISLLIPARFRSAHQQHIERFSLGTDIARRMGERQEVAGRLKNGGEFATEASISKLDVGGERIYTVVLRDITERKRAEKHQGVLAAELDHRVKNILAMVSAIASRTQDASCSMADFVTALDGRIKSMATTHELLSHHRWQGIPLTELVHREFAPYATASNLQIEGSDEVLSAEAGQAIAMVFHELATNAAKYGALSTKGGRVSVSWSHRRNGHAQSWLSIRWEESGGPNVVPPTRSGYGTSVIRDLIPYELGGTVELVHAPEGVCCKLEIPAHWLIASNPASDLSTDLRVRAGE
jgi:PAS domain S-box-containing protein